MFGYVRPLKAELKLKEYEQFKSAYCGLCNTLNKRYGYAARFLLNYDFTFLAMLLSSEEKSCAYQYKRCSASPFKKKCSCVPTPNFELCADYSIVLYYWKLKDSAADEGFWGKVKARAAILLFKPAYKKARKNIPDFDEKVCYNLSQLSALEKSACTSIDETSEKFAYILAAASELRKDEAEKRILNQLLYHLGRIIYILDAIDDLKDDVKSGAYNPVAIRYDTADGSLNEESRNELRITINHSAAMVSTAFELLPGGMWTPVLANIIYLGIPWVAESVLTGTWRKPGKREDKKIFLQNGAD